MKCLIVGCHSFKRTGVTEENVQSWNGLCLTQIHLSLDYSVHVGVCVCTQNTYNLVAKQLCSYTIKLITRDFHLHGFHFHLSVYIAWRAVYQHWVTSIHWLTMTFALKYYALTTELTHIASDQDESLFSLFWLCELHLLFSKVAKANFEIIDSTKFSTDQYIHVQIWFNYMQACCYKSIKPPPTPRICNGKRNNNTDCINTGK